MCSNTLVTEKATDVEKSPERPQETAQLSQPGRGTWIVQLLAYAVIVIAGFKAAADFVIPVLLAIVLTLICVHPTRLLRRWGIPSTPSILIVVAMVIVCSVSVTTFVGNSLTLFGSKVPVYVEAFQQEVGQIDDKWLAFIHRPKTPEAEVTGPKVTGPKAEGGGTATPTEAPAANSGLVPTKTAPPPEDQKAGDPKAGDPKASEQSPTQQSADSLASKAADTSTSTEPQGTNATPDGLTAFEKGVSELVDVGFIMQLVADTTSGALSALSNLAVILLIMIFMLFEAEGLPSKIRRAIGREDASLSNYRAVGDKVFSYVLLKTLMNFATAACVCALLTAMGVEFPVLLALIAFLFNYIPTIGSFIAGIPIIMLSLFSINGEAVTLTPGIALVVGIGYLVINITLGNFIEPKVLGKSLGLSPLVIILSLMFWSWILGPIGMLLSVPLTMVLKIIFDSSHDFSALGVLLGPSDEPSALP